MIGWSFVLVVLRVSPASDALSFPLQLDHILSPPPMPCRKCSTPDLASGPGKSLKFKRQLSEDGRQLRRGSLGGALTGESRVPRVRGACLHTLEGPEPVEFHVQQSAYLRSAPLQIIWQK